MNRLYRIIFILAVSLSFCACGGKKGNDGKMPEMEQLKYDNTMKRIDALAADAGEALACGNETALENIKDEVAHLTYDFSDEKMNDEAKEKCQALKDRITELRDHPEKIINAANGSGKVKGEASKGHTLISNKYMKVAGSERIAYSLYAGDKLTFKLDCPGSDGQGNATVSVYDIDRKKCMRQWTVYGAMTDTVSIANDGIYMMEITTACNETKINVGVTYTGMTQGNRRRAQEHMEDCKKGDFLARQMESVTARSVFNEPKKVGLRSNIKAYFSGKSRVVIPVTLPTDCDAVLYSLRISTNEQTVGNDGRFATNVNTAASKIKLFGHEVYERQSISSSLINRLLFDTRPPRDEDAYCNMYVMTSAAEARKFQDSDAAEKKTYKYDVDQSQMGTQSCNGQMLPNGHKTIYIGFENERMRYDNYIWLELAALTHTTKYVRPAYMAQ